MGLALTELLGLVVIVAVGALLVRLFTALLGIVLLSSGVAVFAAGLSNGQIGMTIGGGVLLLLGLGHLARRPPRQAAETPVAASAHRLRRKDLEADRAALAGVSRGSGWFRSPAPDDVAAGRLTTAWAILERHAQAATVEEAQRCCTRFLALYAEAPPSIGAATLASEITRDIPRWVEAWLDHAVLSPRRERAARLAQVLRGVEQLAGRARTALEAETAQRAAALEAALDTSYRERWFPPASPLEPL